MKKDPEKERRRALVGWWLPAAAFALFALVVTSLGFVVAGPLTLEAQPNVVPSPSTSTQEPVPAPAVTASPADVATSTATEIFDAPDVTILPPPEPPKKGVRAPSGSGGTERPYFGLTAAQYCALKLPAFSTSGSDVTAFLLAANKERAETGAPALSWNSTLATYAQGWSDQMASDQSAHTEYNVTTEAGRNLIDAESYTGSPWRTLVFRHSPTPYAENIAFNYGYSNPVNVAQSGWMGSTGHCLNIMNPDYAQFGAGKTQATDGSWFFTEEFIW